MLVSGWCDYLEVTRLTTDNTTVKMTKFTFYIIAFTLTAGFFSCQSNKKAEETPTRGNATILVDETFYPMIDGQVQVFESQYPYAHLDIITRPEQEIARLLAADTSRIAILSRELTPGEQSYFDNLRLIPRVTEIAYDAIALIVSKAFADPVITETDLQALLAGRSNPGKYVLVFDNSQSSTVKYMQSYAGIDTLPLSYTYSVKSNRELLDYIARTEIAIGFSGVDWLYEPDDNQKAALDNIKVLPIQTCTGTYRPTQNDVAEGTYPFIRKISLINCQGTAGLGLGFASFLAGDIGQRIILKSGLVPVTYPKREIKVRKQL